MSQEHKAKISDNCLNAKIKLLILGYSKRKTTAIIFLFDSYLTKMENQDRLNKWLHLVLDKKLYIYIKLIYYICYFGVLMSFFFFFPGQSDRKSSNNCRCDQC